MKEIAHDPEAKCDIINAARFYEAQVPGLSARFIAAVDATILKIATNPEMHTFCKRPIRSCRVKGFPYRVLFVNEPKYVLIIAVSHLAPNRDGGGIALNNEPVYVRDHIHS